LACGKLPPGRCRQRGTLSPPISLRDVSGMSGPRSVISDAIDGISGNSDYHSFIFSTFRHRTCRLVSTGSTRAPAQGGAQKLDFSIILVLCKTTAAAVCFVCGFVPPLLSPMLLPLGNPMGVEAEKPPGATHEGSWTYL
jgi:hypothetical protein